MWPSPCDCLINVYPPQMNAALTIRAVSNRTGLTPHVIRIWEKRYAAVEPQRTDSNRRYYSESDVEKLGLLGWLIRNGHSIGSIAGLNLEELHALAQSAPKTQATAGSPPNTTGPETASRHMDSALASIRDLDSRVMDEVLNKALIDLGGRGFLQKLMCPLAQRIGELWNDGEMTAAHEHFASAAIKVFVGQITKSFLTPEHAPGIVVATPHGQAHELGAVIVCAAAAHIGWKTTYLGPSLPAAEIAGAAIQNRAGAVALSIVYPNDDPGLPEQLRQLRKALPEATRILAGGRAAFAYHDVLEEIGATVLDSPASLESELNRMRDEPRGA